jgi:hypothetical protein
VTKKKKNLFFEIWGKKEVEISEAKILSFRVRIDSHSYKK